MSLEPEKLCVYLVADPDHCNVPIVDAVELALRSGVTAVQLRAKRMSDRDQLALARKLRSACRSHNAIFLVNDRLDIALLAEADGIHVGDSDISPHDIRDHCGKGLIIGYSPDTADDAAGVAADYLGIGPVFDTSSKADAGAALGLTEFQERVAHSPLPVIGIGGVTPNNARSVIDAGAYGVAVISSILGSPDIPAAAQELVQAVGRAQ